MAWICGRFLSSAGIPPLHAALGRFTFGSLGLLAILLSQRPWPKPDRRTLLYLFSMGFFGVFLYNLCFFIGLKSVPAGRASLVASLQPSFVYLISACLWGERLTGFKLAGIALSFSGAVLALSQGDLSRLMAGGLGLGDLYVLGCALSWVIYTLLGSRVSTFPPVARTAYSTWMGSLLILLAGLGTPPQISAWPPMVWVAVVFLGLGGTTLAFLLFLQGIAAIGASRASIFINLVPVFGILFSTLLLGEPLTLPTLLGGAIVLSGVGLINYKH
jgi:drug/metabolite transporter (DMT)-like permease